MTTASQADARSMDQGPSHLYERHTLESADRDQEMWMDKATPLNQTVRVGFSEIWHAIVPILNVGAGQVSVGAADGVTINTAKSLNLRGQVARAVLIRNGEDEWDLLLR